MIPPSDSTFSVTFSYTALRSARELFVRASSSHLSTSGLLKPLLFCGAGLVEDVGVAVGIDAPRPAYEVGLVAALLRLLERRGELRHADLDVKARLTGHGLDDLSHLPALGIVRHHEIDAE